MAKDKTFNGRQNAGIFKLAEHTIYAGNIFVYLFEKQNCILKVRKVRRSAQTRNQRQVTTKKCPFCHAGMQRSDTVVILDEVIPFVGRILEVQQAIIDELLLKGCCQPVRPGTCTYRSVK